ncbi:MAG: hypothetical protein HS116_01830 [Planctomycetes bacterium]|nr:hypothetical protein [Planctomycetota bacterium]
MNPKAAQVLLLILVEGLALTGAESVERVHPPKPYVFSLGCLTDQDVQILKSVPGVIDVSVGERIGVVWQPFNDGPWQADGSKFIKGAERIFDVLAIKKQIGNTKWTHGGIIGHNAGSIIWYGPELHGSYAVPKVFGIMFDDLRTGRNEVMRITCYSECEPGQLVHEMVRGMIGMPISLRKCGNGYALVADSDKEVRVAWQVSSQHFVTIDFSFDIEMVSSYMDRLGCITPPNFSVSVEDWVENEIRWRMKQLDASYERNAIKGYKSLPFVDFFVSYFQAVGKRFGSLRNEASLLEQWGYLDSCRKFLWSNRHNFKYVSSAGWFALKGEDLYDPAHPPSLPEELRGPPRPSDEQVTAWEQAALDRERKAFEDAFRKQFKDWSRQLQDISKEGQKIFGVDVRYPFEEIRLSLQRRLPIRSRQEAEAWIGEARGRLWANRDNFEWRKNGYYLKGPDLFDPQNPPKVPDDLLGP